MKSNRIYIWLFFIIVLFIICMSFLFRKDIYLYKNFTGTYSNKYLGVFVSKSELEYFYRNRFIFIDGKKVKYEIISVDKDVLKRDVFYSYLLLSINDSFSEGEVILFSIFEKKIVNYKIFRVIWR